MSARWHHCAFAVPWPHIPGENWGHIWGWALEGEIWAISGGRGEWTVWHRPSGKVVTSFTADPARRTSPREKFRSRRLAKLFCEEISTLADWSSPVPPDDPTLWLRLHRLALRLTGGRPDLRLNGEGRAP